MKTEGRWLTPADVEYIRRAADAFPALLAVAQAFADMPQTTEERIAATNLAVFKLSCLHPGWREWGR